MNADKILSAFISAKISVHQRAIFLWQPRECG
jgi:hypothetical protein